MKILITEQQFIRLVEEEEPYELPITYKVGNTKKYKPRTQIHPADKEFVERFLIKKGHLPSFTELQKEFGVVGDYYPEHPYPNVKLRTYMDKFLGKNLNIINAELSKKYNLFTSPLKRGLHGGSKSYTSIDGKYNFRALLEVITYNIFLLSGKENEIEVDSRKFYGLCEKLKKEVDFVWKDKIIIEIAGIEEEKYLDKLEKAKECFEQNGYKYIIIKSRYYEQRGRYIEYYKHFCQSLGIPINEELLETPELLITKLLSYRNMDKDTMQKYIDDNIKKPVIGNPAIRHRLNKYVKHLHGTTVGDYKKKIGLGKNISLDDFNNFMDENPNATVEEIANYFNISHVVAKRMMNEYL